jgi:hypothetical protein
VLPPRLLVLVLLLLSAHLLWHPDVFESVAPDVDLRHAPEAVAILQTAQGRGEFNKCQLIAARMIV